MMTNILNDWYIGQSLAGDWYIWHHTHKYLFHNLFHQVSDNVCEICHCDIPSVVIIIFNLLQLELKRKECSSDEIRNYLTTKISEMMHG